MDLLCTENFEGYTNLHKSSAPSFEIYSLIALSLGGQLQKNTSDRINVLFQLTECTMQCRMRPTAHLKNNMTNESDSNARQNRFFHTEYGGKTHHLELYR